MNKLSSFILKLPLIQQLVDLSKKISLPGFDGLSIFDVLTFFFQRLAEGDVQSRARSIAFSFFLALFPAIIFLFTLIPYIPIEGFQDKLLLLIRDLLPPYTYEASRITIEDIIRHQRGGLLSLGFLFTLYICSNGVLSMINVFNETSRHKPVSAYKLRLKAMWLTVYLLILIILAISLLILSEVAVHFLSEKINLTSKAPIYFLLSGKWLLLLALCFTTISSLYYFGTHKHSKWKFISAGSTLATVLIILTTLAFNYFIVNFGQYNKIYGSIGTLVVILIWINFNCLQLIVGYELNASIEHAKHHHSTKKNQRSSE